MKPETSKTRKNKGAKSQVATEYIMLLGGLLVIVILVIILVRGSILTSAGEDIGNKSEVIRNLTQNLSG